MNKDIKKPLDSIVAYFAIFTAAVFIISYGAVTSYFSGYLNYFGINIRYIDFWPHLPDFMLVAAPMIMAILVMGVISYVVFIGLSYLGGIISNHAKNRWIKILGESLRVTKKSVILTVLIALSLATFSLVYVTQSQSGTEFASHQTKFIRVGADGEKIDLLIYQNGGTAFTKTYDKASKQFEAGYKSISFVDQNLEQIEIPRN